MTAPIGDNAIMFSQATDCPLVEQDVVLYANTWNYHITANHPETKPHLEAIKQTIANPSYVAHSKLGPNKRYTGNLVFVSINTKIGNSNLHIFVQRVQDSPVISSAMFTKSHHSEVAWQKDEELKSSYDEEMDILYLSKDRPQEATTEVNEDGLLLRFSMQDHSPCGVTVMSFRQDWGNQTDKLANQVSDFLHIPKSVAERKLGTVV